MDNFDESRIGADNQTAPKQDVSDATQRIPLGADGSPANPPARRTNGSARTRSSTGTSNAPGNRSRQRSNERKKQQRILLICLLAALVVLLILAVVMVFVLRSSNDKDTIPANVYAAGVNLGGMTKEEAAAALKEATENTYSRIDMTVQVLDTQLVLSPAQTGASLDINAVIEAAFAYSNKSQNSSYTISIVEYLNLDTEYIQSVLAELGTKYSTTLKQSTCEVIGVRPSMDLPDKNPETPHQTIKIYIGTAEYGLNTSALFEQIMDAYNINIFHVTGECTVITPKPLDLDAIYEQYCTPPVNAEFDSDTFIVTPEQYGYGFDLEALKAAVEDAAYGSTVTMDLHFIKPDITSDFYTNDIFQDILSTYATKLSDDAAWNTNLRLVCEALNGHIIKSGEEFSFNDVVGKPTIKRGFQRVNIFVGRSYQEVLGGGICQAASTLYACALLADLEIVERTSHSYVHDFIQQGLDAEVYYGSSDFRFKNTTDQPIRIDAAVEDGSIKISLVGSDNKDYTVKISYKVSKTKQPGIVYNTMLFDNPGGYQNGDILTEGIAGCNVSVYQKKYNKDTGRLTDQVLVSESYYAKRDAVVVQIYVEPAPEPEPEPEPSTDPSTDPSTEPSTDTQPETGGATETTTPESTPSTEAPSVTTPESNTP